ncbi:MAG: N-acetylmuramoyl-L-alanine amidase [Bacteroidetes bacterium]|nr:N-acetylmuramoyl-L-alanine amidase [Bacteroidota bacterium]
MLSVAYYLLKVMICSGILFGYYWFLLRNKVFHRYNRFYIVAAIILSLCLPLIKISFWQQDQQQQNSMIHVLQAVSQGDAYMDNIIVTSQRNATFDVTQLIPYAYVLISALFFLTLAYTFYRIVVLLKRYPKKVIDSISFINTDAKSTPFSFFNYIFWNHHIDIETPTGQQIFKHELAHVEEKHSYDKLFINIVLVFFWCNPFFWLYRRELNMIHEFIADQKAVEDSDTAAFAAMILQATYPQHRFQLTNNFFYSPVKRRLQMLIKNQNPKVNYIGRIMVLPLAALIFAAFTFKTTGVPHLYHGKKIVVVVDAGHGGKDKGAVAADGTTEKEITLAIAKEIQSLNTNKDIEIILTKDNDVYLDKKEKVELVNKNNADMYITIHTGAYPTPEQIEYNLGSAASNKTGITVVIPTSDAPSGEQSKWFGAAVLNEFANNYGLPVTPELIENRSLYTFTNNTCPSLFIETGILTNTADVQYLKSSNGQTTVAKNILAGIEKYAALNMQNGTEARTLQLSPNLSYSSFVNMQYSDTNYLKTTAYKSKALIIVDGKEIGNLGMDYVEKSNSVFSTIVVFNPEEAMKRFGPKGKYGVIKLTQKDAVMLTADSIRFDQSKNTIEVTGKGTKIAGKIDDPANTIIYVDGKKVSAGELNKIDPNTISSVSVLKGDHLDDITDAKGKKAVINVTLKSKDLTPITVTGFQTAAVKNSDPLYVIDNAVVEGKFSLNAIAPSSIERIDVLKNESAVKKYGEKGKNGVIEITTKSGEGVVMCEIENNVAAEATVSLDNEKVLYIGIDNPITAVATSVAPKDLQVTISNGTITGANGKYIARVTAPGDVTISISKKGTDKVLQRFNYKAKTIQLTNLKEVTVTGYPSLQLKPTATVKQDVKAITVTGYPSLQLKPADAKKEMDEVKVDGYLAAPSTATTKPANGLQEVTVVGYALSDSARTANKIFTRTEISPSYPGGNDEWKKFMQKNLDPTIPVDEGWKPGTYTIVVQFIVHEDGSLSDITALNFKDSKTAAHCIELIRKSEHWIPAVQNGRKVNAYRRQPITFVIYEDKKSSLLYRVPLKAHLFMDGKVETYTVASNGQFETQPNMLYYLNGKLIDEPKHISPNIISSIETYDAT